MVCSHGRCILVVLYPTPNRGLVVLDTERKKAVLLLSLLCSEYLNISKSLRNNQHVVDSLDFGNYKKALSEVEKVLKKHPNSNTAKVCQLLIFLVYKPTFCMFSVHQQDV